MRQFIIVCLLVALVGSQTFTLENKISFNCQDDEVQVCEMEQCIVPAVYCPGKTICNKDGDCWWETGDCAKPTCTQNCYCRKK